MSRKILGPIVCISIAGDILMGSEHTAFNALIRGAIMLLALNLAKLQRTTWIMRHAHTLPTHILISTLAIAVCAIGFNSGYGFETYMVRLNLIAVLTFCLMPWRARGLALTAATVYGPFLVLAALSAELSTPIRGSFIALTSTLTLAVIGSMINAIAVRDMHKSFETRLLLFRGMLHKDRVIDEKTRETVHLERLSNQFSPQVLDAIRDGKIALTKKERRDVTAIFIDIENSSFRSQHLDHQQYEEVLSEFFTLATEILIWHNITIGTYLGDGILAFVNAPIETEDHQVIATRACLDLLEQTAKKRQYFSEKWRAEFNIRIGINSGHASVGFFPNSQLGTYTALGESVNLAARLCSSATPNSICISKDFLKKVAPVIRDIRAEPHGNVKDLKGFQSDSLEVFIIQSSIMAVNSTDCPRCFGPLQLKADLDTCNLLQCDVCGYSDVQEKVARVAA